MTVEACRSVSCAGVGYEIGSRSVTGAAKNLSQAQLQALEQVVARWVNNRCSCTTDDLTESESGGKKLRFHHRCERSPRWEKHCPDTPSTPTVSVPPKTPQAVTPQRSLWSEGRKQLERSPEVKAVGGQRTGWEKEGISSYGAWAVCPIISD